MRTPFTLGDVVAKRVIFHDDEAHMSIRVVRLGSERAVDEGLRIGTVRRPPRGIRKADYASKNYYDHWLPVLAPSAATVKLALAARSSADWRRFERKYRVEMATATNRALIELLAALSRQTNFSVGCYCADEARCHRSILRRLLVERGASMV